MADQRWQAKLISILSDCFDEGQARSVCFNLGIDYDSLCKNPETGQPQARPKAETLQALIEFCQRHRIMSQFLSTLRSECREDRSAGADDHVQFIRFRRDKCRARRQGGVR